MFKNAYLSNFSILNEKLNTSFYTIRFFIFLMMAETSKKPAIRFTRKSDGNGSNKAIIVMAKTADTRNLTSGSYVAPKSAVKVIEIRIPLVLLAKRNITLIAPANRLLILS